MTSGSKKVFWGIIIASIHIKVMEFILFPACFGYAVLYFGICELSGGRGRTEEVFKGGKRLRIAAGALVIVSGLIEFLSASGYMGNTGIWMLLPFILEYAVFFHLMELYVSLNPSVSGFRRGYALVMGIALTGFGISLIFSSTVWQIFSGVIILACRMMVLAAAYGDKAR